MAGPRVLLGVIGAPHGVRGLVRIKSYAARPLDIGAYGPLGDEANGRRFTVEALSAKGDMVLARVAGIEDRTAVEALRGIKLYVERSALPAAAEGEWYEADLIGLRAVGRDGRDWGRVVAFHDFGAGKTMEVSGGDGPAAMLPFTDACVPEIDLERGEVTVEPPSGLLPGGDPTKEA
ncbi:MAG: 16S rRNA processing protein RimM [Alphaproteobacteria bacterium]|nr:16S rRNA processing protein RimM [Alphaproteobacteria bacterium]